MLGICGGFQMLCRRIDDAVESEAGVVDGLGLLDADIVFAPDKTLRRHDARCTATRSTTARCRAAPTTTGSASASGAAAVYGTHWHGLLDNDDVCAGSGSPTPPRPRAEHGFVVADDVDVTARRDAQLDLMADLLAAHLDIDAVLGLLEHGPPRPAHSSQRR